jgi:hypothetical protein
VTKKKNIADGDSGTQQLKKMVPSKNMAIRVDRPFRSFRIRNSASLDFWVETEEKFSLEEKYSHSPFCLI